MCLFINLVHVLIHVPIYMYMYKIIVQCYTSELITIVKLVSDNTMKLKSCLSSVYSCKLPSHVVVILCSLFVQFVNFTRAQYLEINTPRQPRVLIFTLLGVVYLPISGLSGWCEIYQISNLDFLMFCPFDWWSNWPVADSNWHNYQCCAWFNCFFWYICTTTEHIWLHLSSYCWDFAYCRYWFFRSQCYSFWVGSTTRGSNTTVKCLHPLVLLESECWTSNCILHRASLVLDWQMHCWTYFTGKERSSWNHFSNHNLCSDSLSLSYTFERL